MVERTGRRDLETALDGMDEKRGRIGKASGG